MNTCIGRIGSQHTLTSTQDDALYLFESAMWCTHPLLGSAFTGGDVFVLTAGSKTVTADGAHGAFSLLCLDILKDNVPYNKYIAYTDGTTYGILEVDYVLDDNTLILKYPAFESVTAQSSASQINYWGTPVLREVECRNTTGAGFAPTQMTYANKYSQDLTNLFDVTWQYANEGGVEPMLITGDGTILVNLKY